MPTAVITGASAGLGRELARALGQQGWGLVLDARTAAPLQLLHDELPGARLLVGDVADPRHRQDLRRTVEELGELDLLVNNASRLGGSPQPTLANLQPGAFADILTVNTVAPAALTAELLPRLEAAAGVVLNVSSDAAVEHYVGWGGYGASKAALDHLTLTFAAEHPTVAWYAVDPGDMRTDLHQQAFPGEDISDRPDPASVVPALLALLAQRPPSGRYRAADFARAPHRVAS